MRDEVCVVNHRESTERFQCAESGEVFDVLPQEIALRRAGSPTFAGETLWIPRPSRSRKARNRRRLSFRNEVYLFKRTCDLTGVPTISVFPEDSPYTVYCYDAWTSDEAWDPLTYGQPIDFTRPFFEQFAELERRIPHQALFQDGLSENSEYVNYGSRNKSCYLIQGILCEDVMFSQAMVSCRSALDCLACFQCELCYDCIDCDQCYEVFYSQDCDGCHSSALLRNCVGCHDCYASINLRNARYVFKNVQLTKEEYARRRAPIRFDSPEFNRDRDEVTRAYAAADRPHLTGLKNEDCTGNLISECKSCQYLFDSIAVEDSCYGTIGTRCHHCVDCDFFTDSSHLVECHGVIGGSEMLGVYFMRNSYRMYYSQWCFNSKNIFGSYGLRRKENCILNQQYSPSEFEQLALRLAKHMMETGEWGEYFPASLSPFPYHQTLANMFYPQVEKDDAAQPFRIIAQEQQFYDRFGIPAPTVHPIERYRQRLGRRPPRELWPRKCAASGRELLSAVPPEYAGRVYGLEEFQARLR